jgi:hypothetical protein
MRKQPNSENHEIQNRPSEVASQADAMSVRKAGAIAASILAVIVLAAALRTFAQSLQSEPLADLSTALLFTPCSLAAITLGWRTWAALPWKLLLAIALCLAVAFPARMLISLPISFSGLWSPDSFARDEAAYWWWVTLLHWLLFIGAASSVCRVIQWCTGFGLWPMSVVQQSNEAGGVAQAKSLTTGRLLILVAVFACAMMLYQSWVRAWYPTLFISAQSDIALQGDIAPQRANEGSYLYPPGPPAWYQLFPIASMPWANGLIGGLLLPIHWMFIAWVLGFAKSNRSMWTLTIGPMLIGWVFVAAGLRLLTTKLYFAHRMIFADYESSNGILDDWIKWTLGGPVSFLVQQAPYSPAFSHQVVQAAIQLALTMMSIIWLQWIGYRLGRYKKAAKGQA